MSLRLCMIGCGAFARELHGPAQQRCADETPDLQRVACCDTDPSRASAYAQAVGYERSYADAAEMLAREKPDAVIMAVPPAVTAAAAIPVLRLGVPLLLEKPPGRTLAELAELRAAAARAGGRAQVGFNRRHMPVMRRAREVLASAFHAQPPFAIEYEMVRHERWDADFSTTAVHAIDAVRVLADQNFESATLQFQLQRQGDRRTANILLELECASGLRVRVSLQPVAGLNRETAVIHAPGQTLELTVPFPSGPFATGELKHWRANQLVIGWADQADTAVERMGIYAETRAFIDAVRTGSPLAPAPDECVQQVELMELLRRGEAGRFVLHAR